MSKRRGDMTTNRRLMDNNNTGNNNNNRICIARVCRMTSEALNDYRYYSVGLCSKWFMGGHSQSEPIKRGGRSGAERHSGNQEVAAKWCHINGNNVGDNDNKKAELSQRWPTPRDVPYGRPENFPQSLTTPTATSPEFLMGFCSDWAYKCACKIWNP